MGIGGGEGFCKCSMCKGSVGNEVTAEKNACYLSQLSSCIIFCHKAFIMCSASKNKPSAICGYSIPVMSPKCFCIPFIVFSFWSISAL